MKDLNVFCCPVRKVANDEVISVANYSSLLTAMNVYGWQPRMHGNAFGLLFTLDRIV